MISIAKSPFAPKNLPDGRVAHYYLPRRSFVVITKSESDRLLNRSLGGVFAIFFLFAACIFLWLMFSKGIIALDLPILVTGAAAIIAAIINHAVTRGSKELLMRAPLSTEKAPPFNLSHFFRIGMATMDDRMLRKSIRAIILCMALSGLYLAMGYFGHGHRPAKGHIVVASCALLPFMLILLIAFRREQARRKTLAQDNPNP